MPLDEAPVQASSRPTAGPEDGEGERRRKAGMWGHGQSGREPKEWAWWLWRDVSDQFSILVHFLPCAVVLWLAGHYDFSFTATFLLCGGYLAHVVMRQRQVMRAKHRMEMLQDVFRRRPMGDSESARWLNQLLRRMWPICLERCFSEALIPAAAPWFFQRYKPWHLKRAWLRGLYLGSAPPFVASMRMLSTNLTDDHAVMEMMVEYIASDDMLAVLGGTARKRVALGLSAQALVSDFHLEGKLRVGVRFQRHWPYISRIRLTFSGAPFITLSVKPVGAFNITELPFFGKWVDTLLASALESFLVEPNMLCIDVVKLVHMYTMNTSTPAAAPTPQQPSPQDSEKKAEQQAGNGRSAFPANHGVIDSIRVEQAPPIAHVVIEILGASNLNGKANLNGKSDPYVKGALGTSRFTTRVVASTTDPEWFEEFVAPIYSWSVPNLLVLRVQDRGLFSSKSLGYYVVDLATYRHLGRAEFWAVLSGAKTGRIHLAVTVVAELAWRRRMGVPLGGESPLPMGREGDDTANDEDTEELQVEEPPPRTRDAAADVPGQAASMSPTYGRGGVGRDGTGRREPPRAGPGPDSMQHRIYHTPDAGDPLPGGLRQLRSNSLRHPPPQAPPPPSEECQGRRARLCRASVGLSDSLQARFEALRRKYDAGQQPLFHAPGGIPPAQGTGTPAAAGPQQQGPGSRPAELSPLSQDDLRRHRLSKVDEAEASARLGMAGPEPSLRTWGPAQASHASPEDDGLRTGWSGEILSPGSRFSNSAHASATSFASGEASLTRTHSWHSDTGTAGWSIASPDGPEPRNAAPMSPTHSEECLGLTNFLDFDAQGARAFPLEVQMEESGEAWPNAGSVPRGEPLGAGARGLDYQIPGQRELSLFSDSTRRWLEARQASVNGSRGPRGCHREGAGGGRSPAATQAEGSSAGGRRPGGGVFLQRLNQMSATTVRQLEERAADADMERMQDEDGYHDLEPCEEAWLQRARGKQDEVEIVGIAGAADAVHVLRQGGRKAEAAAKQGYMDGNEKGPRLHALLDALKEGRHEILEGAGTFFGGRASKVNATKDWEDDDVLGGHVELHTQALEELDRWDERREEGEGPPSAFWGRTPSEQVASRPFPSRSTHKKFSKHFK